MFAAFPCLCMCVSRVCEMCVFLLVCVVCLVFVVTIDCSVVRNCVLIILACVRQCAFFVMLLSCLAPFV